MLFPREGLCYWLGIWSVMGERAKFARHIRPALHEIENCEQREVETSARAMSNAGAFLFRIAQMIKRNQSAQLCKMAPMKIETSCRSTDNSELLDR
jgi:hypothetical protein